MRFSQLLSIIELLRNLGIRYIMFRIGYAFQCKTGLIKLRFPAGKATALDVSLDAWRSQTTRFFSFPASSLQLEDNDLTQLAKQQNEIVQNRYPFFSATWYKMLDWHTNPITGFRYDTMQHWSQIPSLSETSGDIKYVWEKSRFTFLYQLIRYDFHFKKDQSNVVFARIESWIDANPVNCGPNWLCSQEIALRVLNWAFALHYYKNSAHLTQCLFQKVISSVYDQVRHVRENLAFSRIAVRNNHALTEILSLYLTGLLFPFFPDSAEWKEKGKNGFAEEIEFQIASDGTFLQHSMNYHRIVVQLLSWGIALAELNGEKWSELVYDRARQSVQFLRTCQDDVTGWLPNYGNNDGALFFPLTPCHFRDYRPQLAALACLLKIDLGYDSGPWDEEMFWITNTDRVGSRNIFSEEWQVFRPSPATVFPENGYYMIRDLDSITFLRCGKYINRPFQADNLHLDLWVNGENILRDAGSYQYNTHENDIRYFAGTASHNSIMIGELDQMKRGPRFTWYNWIKEAGGTILQLEASYYIQAQFTGFTHLNKGIKHKRSVSKEPGQIHWIIEDYMESVPVEFAIHQIWHPYDFFFDNYEVRARDEYGNDIPGMLTHGWYSETYGQKIPGKRLVFSFYGRYIRTVIRSKKL